MKILLSSCLVGAVAHADGPHNGAAGSEEQAAARDFPCCASSLPESLEKHLVEKLCGQIYLPLDDARKLIRPPLTPAKQPLPDVSRMGLSPAESKTLFEKAGDAYIPTTEALNSKKIMGDPAVLPDAGSLRSLTVRGFDQSAIFKKIAGDLDALIKPDDIVKLAKADGSGVNSLKKEAHFAHVSLRDLNDTPGLPENKEGFFGEQLYLKNTGGSLALRFGGRYTPAGLKMTDIRVQSYVDGSLKSVDLCDTKARDAAKRAPLVERQRVQRAADDIVKGLERRVDESAAALDEIKKLSKDPSELAGAQSAQESLEALLKDAQARKSGIDKASNSVEAASQLNEMKSRAEIPLPKPGNEPTALLPVVSERVRREEKAAALAAAEADIKAHFDSKKAAFDADVKAGTELADKIETKAQELSEAPSLGYAKAIANINGHDAAQLVAEDRDKLSRASQLWSEAVKKRAKGDDPRPDAKAALALAAEAHKSLAAAEGPLELNYKAFSALRDERRRAQLDAEMKNSAAFAAANEKAGAEDKARREALRAEVKANPKLVVSRPSALSRLPERVEDTVSGTGAAQVSQAVSNSLAADYELVGAPQVVTVSAFGGGYYVRATVRKKTGAGKGESFVVEIPQNSGDSNGDGVVIKP